MMNRWFPVDWRRTIQSYGQQFGEALRLISFFSRDVCLNRHTHPNHNFGVVGGQQQQRRYLHHAAPKEREAKEKGGCKRKETERHFRIYSPHAAGHS
jgi:hypothetical protein